MEAVKPLLEKREAHLILTDEMINAGDRFYIKATATVWQGDKEIASATGYAREALTKKGMDDSQITGTASSYARKYALNGLFAIDDAKDADTDEHQNQQDKSPDKPEDDKPWYNDFEQHKDMMSDKIGDGESTADEIIANLRKNYKVSRKTAEQIKALGA